MLRRARVLGVASGVGALLVACQIFAVRMPSRGLAGESVVIQMDLRATSSETTVAPHCARLPSSWAVTAATYTRTVGDVASAGSLSVASSSATALDTNAPLAGHKWVCYQGPSTAYTTDDFGTARWTVTVQTPGTYELLFASVSADGAGTVNSSATRRFVVDGAPDWRFDAASTVSPLVTSGWTSVKAFGELSFIAVDFAGNAHVTTDGGLTWGTRAIVSANLWSVERLNNTFIAVGANGFIYTTANPLGAWTLRASETTQLLSQVCTDGTTAYIVGAGGYVATSANGTTWFGTTVPSVGNITSCAAVPGAGAFVTTSTGDVFKVTHTGAAPTISDTSRPATLALTAIAYMPTPVPKLLVTGADIALDRALDGGSWTGAPSPTSAAVQRLRVVDGTVYAVGVAGMFAGSPTGTIAWTNFGSGTSSRINDIAITSKVALLVGDSGARLRAGVPNLAFDGESTTLPRTSPGVASQAVVFLQNDGKGTLYTSAPTITAPFAASYDCDGVLDEGEACEVTVTLSSATRGLYAGTLTVPSSSAIQRTFQVVGIVGNDAIASATLDGTTPITAVDFGNVAVGTTATRTVLLRNAGDAPLTVGAVAGLVTPTTPFAITDNQCSDRTVAAGATCPIAVSFRPFGQDGAAQAFDVVSNDPTSPRLFVQLVGVGAPPADIRIDDALAFPDTAIGDSSEVALLITNVGRGPLDIASLTIDGAGFTLVDAAPFTIAPGENAERKIRFSPVAEGPQTARLVVTSNDPDTADQAVTMTAIALAESHGSTKDDGGCAAVDGSLAALMTICACGAYRCAGRLRRRTTRSHA